MAKKCRQFRDAVVREFPNVGVVGTYEQHDGKRTSKERRGSWHTHALFFNLTKEQHEGLTGKVEDSEFAMRIWKLWAGVQSFNRGKSFIKLEALRPNTVKVSEEVDGVKREVARPITTNEQGRKQGGYLIKYMYKTAKVVPPGKGLYYYSHNLRKTKKYTDFTKDGEVMCNSVMDVIETKKPSKVYEFDFNLNDAKKASDGTVLIPNRFMNWVNNEPITDKTPERLKRASEGIKCRKTVYDIDLYNDNEYI